MVVVNRRRPFRQRPYTLGGEVGRIVEELLYVPEQPDIDSNFIFLASGTTPPGTSGSGLSSSAWTLATGNQYATINLGSIADDAGDFIVWIVARRAGGNPFCVTPGKNDAVPGELFWTWYKDAAGDLNVRVWNGLETLEVKAWFA